MKILQLVTKRQFRGAEVFAAELSKQLLQRNHTLLFVGLYAPANPPLEVEGAKHIDLVTNKSRFFSITLLYKLIQLIKSEKPDIIQANGSDTLKYVAIAKLFTKVPPITYRNISMISVWINSPLKKFWVKTVMKQVDFVTSVGEFARQDFIKTLNYPKDKIRVISRGIPVHAHNPNKGKDILKERFPYIQNDDPLVMHIGNFSPEKNHLFLLEVMEILKTENQTIRLICIGEGVLYNEIQSQINQLNLQENVLLFGFYPNPGHLLAAGNVFVLCSLVEGVPGVILEAGAQKLPTVAVNVGGIQEVLLNDQTGFIVDYFNSRIFAEKVLQLLQDKKLRNQMGEKAYELVENQYNTKTNAIKFENLYNEVIQNSQINLFRLTQ